MSNQSVSEIIDSWETHGLQNLHEINLDRIYAFPMARGDLHMHDNSVQWHLDHHGISRQRLVETKDEQVKSLMVDIEHQLRELSERTWKHKKIEDCGWSYGLIQRAKVRSRTSSDLQRKTCVFSSCRMVGREGYSEISSFFQ